MLYRLSCFFIAFLLLCSNSAFAETRKVHVGARFLTPELMPTFERVFSDVRKHPRHVHSQFSIYFPGGQLSTAYHIAAIVDGLEADGYNISVIVKDGMFCGSACNIIFAAFDKRFAEPRAMFMFHRLTEKIPPHVYERYRGQLEARRHHIVERYLRQIAAADPTFASYLRNSRVIHGSLRQFFLAESDNQQRMPASWLNAYFPGWVQIVYP